MVAGEGAKAQGQTGRRLRLSACSPIRLPSPNAATLLPAPHWLHHLEDEADAAYLYRELARPSRTRHKSELYQKLAAVEDRHVEMWRKLLAENGHATGVPAPSRAARLRAWLARRLGSGFLLPMLLEEEGREVKGYLSLYQEAPDGGRRPHRPPPGQGVEGARRDAGRRSAAAAASRGTRPGPAGSSGTWSTGSTTGSPPTSASSPA